MVIIWLMMVNNNLVGGFSPTPLKNDGVSSSVGMMKFSTEWKVIIFMFQTNQMKIESIYIVYYVYYPLLSHNRI